MAGLDSSEASKPFAVTRELIATKQGKSYAPEVRKLYYSLLADKVPASKIAIIIRTVIKNFRT